MSEILVLTHVDYWAVAGAECNTVIGLKQAQHDAYPLLLS